MWTYKRILVAPTYGKEMTSTYEMDSRSENCMEKEGGDGWECFHIDHKDDGSNMLWFKKEVSA